MTHAQYQRGSAAISRQFEQEAYDRATGRDKWSRHNPNALAPAPTPRPPEWGDKVFQRALVTARGFIRHAVRAKREGWGQDPQDPTLDGVRYALSVLHEKVAAATRERAAQAAWAEYQADLEVAARGGTPLVFALLAVAPR